MSWPWYRCRSHAFSNTSMKSWRTATILNFVKCCKFCKVLDENNCTTFGRKLQHDYAEMLTRPTMEPEVNLRDVISRTSGPSQSLYYIFEPKLVHSSRNTQPSRRYVPDSLIMKIEDGVSRHIAYRKMSVYLRADYEQRLQLLSAYMWSRALATTTTTSYLFIYYDI